MDNETRRQLSELRALVAAGGGTPVTAGAGLAQVGSAFNVVAADGSLVVGANDIAVGVISDAQHGSRAGGTLHAAAVAGGAAGFLSGANAAKLANLSGTNSGDVTIGTANGLSLVAQALSLAEASSSAAGAMSAADKAKLDILYIYDPSVFSVAALQVAIDAKASTGLRIILGSGTLSLGSGAIGLTLNGNIIIEGQGESATFLSYTGTGVGVQVGTGIGVETLRAGLKYLTIDGNNGNCVGLCLGAASGTQLTGSGYFENITVKRCVGAAGAGVKIQMSALATWVRCTFQSNRDGFWSSSAVDNGATTQLFLSCRFITNTKRGMFVEQFDTWNILGCQFEDNGEEGALVKHPGTSTTATRNLTIDNSYFEDNGAAGAFADLRFDNASTFSLAAIAIRRTRFQGTNPDGNVWFGKGNFIEEDNEFSPVAVTNCIASNSTVCFVASRSNRAPSAYWTLGANAPTVHTRYGGDGTETKFYNLAGTATRYGFRPTTAATITHVAMDTHIFASASAAAVTVNLLTAVGNRGMLLTVVKTDASANTVTIDPNGAQTVNGAATKVLAAQYDRCTVMSDGANWIQTG